MPHNIYFRLTMQKGIPQYEKERKMPSHDAESFAFANSEHMWYTSYTIRFQHDTIHTVIQSMKHECFEIGGVCPLCAGVGRE